MGLYAAFATSSRGIRGVRYVLVQVKTKDGKEVGTPNIVLATTSPLHHNLAIHSRQHPYRSYIVGLRIPEVSLHGDSPHIHDWHPVKVVCSHHGCAESLHTGSALWLYCREKALLLQNMNRATLS